MDTKIDFVLTWLDDSDAFWLKQKEKYDTGSENDSNSCVRYRDWGLLKYWFRATEENAPWVNRIFFVTCGQKPDWLKVDNPKLVLVDHEDYIPHDALPTFNSNVIELYFNRIKGLNEQFVYFNDDVFLNAKVKSADFFKEGLPVDKLAFNAVSAKSENRIIEHTILNNLELLSRDFSKKEITKRMWAKIYSLKNRSGAVKSLLLAPWSNFTGIENHHSAQPFLKSSYDAVWRKYNKWLLGMNNNKFRTKDDYSWWVVRYYQLFAGKYYPSSLRDRKFYNISSDLEQVVSDIGRKKHKIICINDSDNNSAYEADRARLIKALEKRYPKKSSFEVGA